MTLSPQTLPLTPSELCLQSGTPGPALPQPPQSSPASCWLKPHRRPEPDQGPSTGLPPGRSPSSFPLSLLAPSHLHSAASQIAGRGGSRGSNAESLPRRPAEPGIKANPPPHPQQGSQGPTGSACPPRPHPHLLPSDPRALALDGPSARVSLHTADFSPTPLPARAAGALLTPLRTRHRSPEAGLPRYRC